MISRNWGKYGEIHIIMLLLNFISSWMRISNLSSWSNLSTHPYHPILACRLACCHQTAAMRSSVRWWRIWALKSLCPWMFGIFCKAGTSMNRICQFMVMYVFIYIYISYNVIYDHVQSTIYDICLVNMCIPVYPLNPYLTLSPN